MSIVDLEGIVELSRARHYLSELEHGAEPYDFFMIKSMVVAIRANLVEAGKDISALDIAGESASAEMEARLQQAKDRAHLTSAQAMFVELETEPASEIEPAINTIRAHLAEAGKDTAALDPYNASTAAQMEERLQEARQQAYLVNAQDLFSELVSSSPFPGIDPRIETIREYLAEARKDAAALDPSGVTSGEQIEAQLRNVEQQGHLTSAQRLFSELENSWFFYSKADRSRFIKAVRLHMIKADKDLSALDPTGTSTTAQMEVRLQNVAERDDSEPTYEQKKAVARTSTVALKL